MGSLDPPPKSLQDDRIERRRGNLMFENLTLSLALLLGLGFIAAKLGQLVKLPSVTGYILAGIALGPSGLHLVSQAVVGTRLEHFTQMALMLIAFGIGEHLELRRLGQVARSVGLIGLAETSGALILVGVGTFSVAMASSVGQAHWTIMDYLVLGLLLGAVSVATAPAATLHVMRELGAKGPLTTTLMAVVAVDDGIAIMIFGIALAMAKQIVGAQGASPLLAAGGGLLEILSSLAMGIATGLMIDFMVHRLRRHGEMLTVGLSLLLLCGEAARMLHLSPLLAGMAAGFTIVNRDRRDVRVFRSINAFEPPIYVLFFTLAGAHLNLSALLTAGWVGGVYFLFRIAGKMIGASLGAKLASSPKVVQRYLGMALMPQAGVAIGLVFLIRGEETLSAFSDVIIPVVLAGVVLSELTGPLCARLAVTRANEAYPVEGRTPRQELKQEAPPLELIPWVYERLTPPSEKKGYVLFEASSAATAPALARISTLLAHYSRSIPVAVGVPQAWGRNTISSSRDTERIMELACTEVEEMGYVLETSLRSAQTVADGLLQEARERPTKAVVLGHPHGGFNQGFHKMVSTLAQRITCPVIVVRFYGVLHTERIMVAVTEMRELDNLSYVILALSAIGWHKLTFVHLLPSGSTQTELRHAEDQIQQWADEQGIRSPLEIDVISTESWLLEILRHSIHHDLLVMAATPSRGLQRFFLGSLPGDVAKGSRRPMLVVHPGNNP
jgi:Kef-type K+ transport system membrane component KefB